MGLGGHFCWGRKIGGRSTLALVGQNIALVLCIYVEGAKEAIVYLLKALKNFYDSSSTSPPPSPPGKFWNLGSLRVHLVAICTIFKALRWVLQLANDIIRTARRSKSSWATRCGISCMDIPHPLRVRSSMHGRSGNSPHSCNVLGIRPYACRSDKTIYWWKIPLHQTKPTEQRHRHTNWMKMLTMLMSRETSLDMNSDWCRTLLVKATI